MPTTPQHAIGRLPEGFTFDVAGMNDGRYIGPSETSQLTDPDGTAEANDTAASTRLTLEQARARLDELVKACDVGGGRSSFRKQKHRLVSDIAAPYALFHFVQSDPNRVAMLRQHDVLKERVRRISASKVALMCLYCKLKPVSDEDKKSCSDWTIWLEQALQEGKPPGEFVDWAMGASFKDCREAVRERRRAAKMPTGRPRSGADSTRRLSVRETADGAAITLCGHGFSIPKAVMEEVFAIVEGAAPKGLLAPGNDNEAGDDHA